MVLSDSMAALAGGVLIGLASLLMLLLNGRILGISGIVGGLFRRSPEGAAWRCFFLVGLLAGGLLLSALHPGAFAISPGRSTPALVAAGLLVGFGTRLGSGCTSGHGVCGVSRLSPRSLTATGIFMALGAATVFVVNRLLGGSV